MPGAKQEALAMLRELRDLTELDEQDPNAFRVRAYERAVTALASAGDDIASMSVADLQKIPGIGKGTAAKIRELFDTGRVAKLDELRRRYPPSFRRLARIPDLGPKSLHRLRAELGIESLEQLQAALDAGALDKVRGFGPRRAQNLARAIARLELDEGRWPIAEAMPVARRIADRLRACPGVALAEVCGSLRRLCETVHDVDVVVATSDPGAVGPRVPELCGAAEVLASGATKISVRLESGLQVDVRLVAPESSGAAQLYCTGSKAHNIRLRQLAMARGWRLSEYALTEEETGTVIAAAREEDIYAALELPFIPPPMREDSGELDGGPLPAPLARDALIGDLHVHTDLSGDGESSLEDMLSQGLARGYRYVAITDHAEDLAMIGVGRAEMLAQRERLDGLRRRFDDLVLLHGCELNIGPRGELDYDREFRASFDWCVASVHSSFEQGTFEQTRRVIEAMRDPAVNVIGHLSGRRIGRRPGIEIDVDAILEAAALTGTAIEINSALGRLDASAEVLRRARDRDVTFVISTDAHHVTEYDRMQWGALQAQRGWVDPARVANTWPPERFLAWARSKRRRLGGG